MISLPQIPKTTGLVLYEGPSLLNQKPIVVIATGLLHSSVNKKTGDMIQTWILPQDNNPVEASKIGIDDAVCGDCKHRRYSGGACYVNLGQAPLNIWKTWKNGKYPVYSDDYLHLFKGRKIRLGAYGEPSAVPTNIWLKILSVTDSHTGYTHQWNNDKINAAELQKICMASVDSEDEFLKATNSGWRTFRVKLPDSPKFKYEFVCPASEEENKRLTCEDCMACNGNPRGKGGSVTINAHGAIKKRYYDFVNKS